MTNNQELITEARNSLDYGYRHEYPDLIRSLIDALEDALTPRVVSTVEGCGGVRHGVGAEEYAQIIAKAYEPDLDWENPDNYDLADREELTASAEKILATLAWSGFVIQRIDDLALDEFDLPVRQGAEGHTHSLDHMFGDVSTQVSALPIRREGNSVPVAADLLPDVRAIWADATTGEEGNDAEQ